MLNELQPITIIWMPHNHRGPSPHLPVGFDIEEWCDEHGRDEPLPYQPVKQDGSGLTMQLPSSCLCTTHDTADGLVVSLQADIGSVSPEAADDLWRRIRDYNAGLALLQRAIDPRRQGLVPPQAQPLQEPPPEPEPSDKTHSEDDDPPDEIDYSGGFGRP